MHIYRCWTCSPSDSDCPPSRCDQSRNSRRSAAAVLLLTQCSRCHANGVSSAVARWPHPRKGAAVQQRPATSAAQKRARSSDAIVDATTPAAAHACALSLCDCAVA
eukprot:365255-Chlamydomonas_euryale.AAC.39